MAWALCGLAWLAGCGLQLQMQELWGWERWAWLAGPALLLWPLAWWCRGRWWSLVFWVLAALSLAWSATHLRAQLRWTEALPPALEGQDLALVGTVASLPQ